MAIPRILIVSLGSIGRRHLENAGALLPKADIRVLRLSGGTETTEDVQFCSSLREALAWRPWVAVLCNPATTRPDVAVPLAEAGVPLFLEKPVAANSKGLADLLAMPTTPVMVGYILRHLPILKAARTALHQGEVGKVYTALLRCGQYLPDWRSGTQHAHSVSARRELGGGVLRELSHEVDAALWLFGQPRSVIASLGRLSDLDLDVEDSAVLVFEHAATRIVIDIDFLARVPRRTISVTGSAGSLEVDLIAQTAQVLEPSATAGRSLNAGRFHDGNDKYLRQLDHFFAETVPGYAPRFAPHDPSSWATLADGAAALELILSAELAAASGTRQEIAR